ncbi:MAG: hypothetical protein HY294_06110 [Candidatus Rokubacteria bacterium]|nr:hypothetical protein [Candidatus Rokubacteria bacterium]MBI3825548.1 hypothetical protein [Candidatus Rokubacteria bacterium]
MTARPCVLTVLGAVLGTAACGSSPSSTPPAPKVSASVAAVPAGGPGQAAAESARPKPAPPTYEPRGRRDPFQTLEVIEGTARPMVTTAKLTGIVKSGGAPWALVETSDGVGYILRVGDSLGESRVVEIGPDSVVFGITARPGSGANRVVLKLAGD